MNTLSPSDGPNRPLHRLRWSLGLAAFWTLGYLFLGRIDPLVPVFDPALALDTRIPFVAWSVWPYLLGVVGIVLPAALLHSPALFRRTVRAYGLVIALSFLCFLLLPVNATSLRQHSDVQGLDLLTALAITGLHRLDPPTNLLPSMHVSLASLAALALAQELPAWRPWIGLVWLLTTLSVCMLKQHYLLDVLSGLLLALAIFKLMEILAKGDLA